MNKRDKILMRDILDAAHRAQAFIAGVNYDIVWQVVTTNLSTLIPQLETLLAADDE